MVDCIVKRSDLRAKLLFFLEFLTGNERFSEASAVADPLAKKMSQRLKELLEINYAAQNSRTHSSSGR
jgi:hypothetical protein